MNKINAEIIADSISPEGHRITTYILTYPRFIHSELMTHRVFSRNSASSRAIPFEKMVDMCEKDPFIPIAWQKDHKGMQGNEYFSDLYEIGDIKLNWLGARDEMIRAAKALNNLNVTKQLCNRLLEPFMWHKVLVTSTEYNNFFDLRCPKYEIKTKDEILSFKSKKDLCFYEGDGWTKDRFTIEQWQSINKSGAEIHIQALAESMWDTMNESVPQQLKYGEWHIPFGDQIHNEDSYSLEGIILNNKLKIATARCARTSYNTFNGEINYQKDIELHDNLLENMHLSPFEHCAKVPSYDKEDIIGITHIDKRGNLWSGNLQGWIQYRQLL